MLQLVKSWSIQNIVYIHQRQVSIRYKGNQVINPALLEESKECNGTLHIYYQHVWM